MSFPPVNFPNADLKLRQTDAVTQVWDIGRKKWLILTPEEWVRQHLLHYLVFHLNYPLSLLAAEQKVKYNQRNKRYDLLIYHSNGKPLLLAECKAPGVKINQVVMDQAAVYNKIIKAPYVCLSNGLQHFCVFYHENNFTFLNEIPTYENAILKLEN